jgi:hypothetical protein
VVLAELVLLAVQQTHVQILHQTDVMSLEDQAVLTQVAMLAAEQQLAVSQQAEMVHQVVLLQ